MWPLAAPVLALSSAVILCEPGGSEDPTSILPRASVGLTGQVIAFYCGRQPAGSASAIVA